MPDIWFAEYRSNAGWVAGLFHGEKPTEIRPGSQPRKFRSDPVKIDLEHHGFRIWELVDIYGFDAVEKARKSVLLPCPICGCEDPNVESHEGIPDFISCPTIHPAVLEGEFETQCPVFTQGHQNWNKFSRLAAEKRDGK